VGTQECDYPPRDGFYTCHEDFVSTLSAHVADVGGDAHVLLSSESLGQMRLCVFVRMDVLAGMWLSIGLFAHFVGLF